MQKKIVLIVFLMIFLISYGEENTINKSNPTIVSNPLSKYISNEIYINGNSKFKINRVIFSATSTESSEQLKALKTKLESKFKLITIMTYDGVHSAMLSYKDKDKNVEKKLIIKGKKSLTINDLKYYVVVYKDKIGIIDAQEGKMIYLYLYPDETIN